WPKPLRIPGPRSGSHGFLPASPASVTLADAIVPLALASPTAGHGRRGPGGQPPVRGAPRGARAAYDDAMQLEAGASVVSRAAGGTDVSYAGPDRKETLP